jgi:hypothetical protein
MVLVVRGLEDLMDELKIGIPAGPLWVAGWLRERTQVRLGSTCGAALRRLVMRDVRFLVVFLMALAVLGLEDSLMDERKIGTLAGPPRVAGWLDGEGRGPR